MDIIIRNVPDEVISALDSLKGDLSREEFLRRKLVEIVEAGDVPRPRFGHGLQATTSTGGKVLLRQLTESISGGASNLNQEQFDAYRRAKLILDPRNGGDWNEAKAILEAVGFEVFWD